MMLPRRSASGPCADSHFGAGRASEGRDEDAGRRLGDDPAEGSGLGFEADRGGAWLLAQHGSALAERRRLAPLRTADALEVGKFVCKWPIYRI